MEASTIVERDFTALGMLFNLVINDLKNSTPVFEDFIIKSTKLHTQLKATIIASTAFLNSFQQIADMATSARGGTKDIGSALTRLCLRQRSVESHLKTFTSSIMDCLIIPLQERLEEWKKINAQLDKEHSKEYKKYRQELKKRPSESNLTGQGLILYKDGQKESIYQSQQSMATLKLKKLRLSSISSNGNQPEPIYASMDLNDKLIHFEQQEKNAVRRALIEERSRYCILVSFLKNVIEEELLITQETSHLQEVMENLNKLTVDPYTLPASSELVISDIKLGNSKGQYSSLNETLKNNSEIYASTQQLRQQQLQNQQQQSQVIYGHLLNQQQPTQQTINQQIHLQNQNMNSVIPPQQQPPQLPTSQPPTGQLLHSNHLNNLNNQLNHLNNQTPPSSPSSFSSRKSSCCSISSFNSSSSGSTHSPSLHHHHLTGHHHHHHFNNNNNNRYSQNGHLPIRIPSIASHTSSDSGFASNADTLSLNQVPSLSEHHSGTLNTRNWVNNDQTDQINQLNSARPHTISASCYEKQRPALSSETFVEPIYESKTLNFKQQDLRNRNNLTLVNDTISKSNNGHTTVIKVESKQLSNYDHQQKFIEELDNVINNQSKINSSQPTSKSNSPPQPPTRKSSVISIPQTVDQNGIKLTNNETASNDDTLCSEGSIGSITPTNPTQQDLNLYRLSNAPIEDKSNSYLIEKNQKQQQQCLNDELTATLTRQNKNNKLSTSCTNLINTTLSTYHNNQLSLTNLNQVTTVNKAAPPPPIRRTSSISNPNAITLGTLAQAGVSTYEEIKTLTLTRNKKNTTNYATCDDVSRLGMNNSNKNMINNNESHYATFVQTNNQDIYGINYNNCFNTYSGNRTNYRINSCSTLQAHDKFYSELNSNDLDKNEEKEKTINQLNQLRSEYMQAKNLFENLECNQQQTKSTTDIYSSNNLVDSSQNDFQAYLIQKHQQLQIETDSGCSSNNGSSTNDSQTSGSSISGQISGHISRMSTVKREFLETLNAKLSSPLVKSSPKMKRRSLSIGHDSEYDYDLNESLSSNKTISSNLTNDKNKAENGHFSQFMRLVQTNYAKITRSPEITRKFSANLTSTNQTGNSLLNASYNSSLTNILFGGNNNTAANNQNSIIKAEMAKEIASIAIKKKQTNSYPTNCGQYEVLSSFQNNKKKEPIYSTSCLNNTTTTIQVDNLNNNNILKSTTNCQEIYQPAQNLQLKANNLQNQNNQQSEPIRRFSQPNMGIKITTNRQNQLPNQLNLNQQNQTQKLNSNDNVQKSFLQNADEKANFLSKLDAKLSPTKIVSPTYNKQQQLKTKNEFDNQVQATARVDAWLNKLSPEEETNCRENLLDQIRKGKALRKVEKIDDRSAPKI